MIKHNISIVARSPKTCLFSMLLCGYLFYNMFYLNECPIDHLFSVLPALSPWPYMFSGSLLECFCLVVVAT